MLIVKGIPFISFKDCMSIMEAEKEVEKKKQLEEALADIQQRLVDRERQLQKGYKNVSGVGIRIEPPVFTQLTREDFEQAANELRNIGWNVKIDGYNRLEYVGGRYEAVKDLWFVVWGSGDLHFDPSPGYLN